MGSERILELCSGHRVTNRLHAPQILGDCGEVVISHVVVCRDRHRRADDRAVRACAITERRDDLSLRPFADAGVSTESVCKAGLRSFYGLQSLDRSGDDPSEGGELDLSVWTLQAVLSLNSQIRERFRWFVPTLPAGTRRCRLGLPSRGLCRRAPGQSILERREPSCLAVRRRFPTLPTWMRRDVWAANHMADQAIVELESAR